MTSAKCLFVENPSKTLKTHCTVEQSSFKCDKREHVFKQRYNLKNHVTSHKSSRFPARRVIKCFGESLN